MQSFNITASGTHSYHWILKMPAYWAQTGRQTEEHYSLKQL